MRNFLTDNGYTLVDAVIQLAVLLLFSQLILFYSVWLTQVEKHFFLSESLEWEMFSLEMETILFSVTAIDEQVNQTGIRLKKDGVEYEIECYPSLIRKQKNRLGHEPLLTGVKMCMFQFDGNQVIVQVEFLNGRKEERAYEVFLSSQ